MKKSQKPVIELLNDFYEYLDIERGLSNKSQETYTRFLSRFKEWIIKNNLEDLKPHQITEKHIWDYRVFLSGCRDPRNNQPIKRKTQNYYLIALRSLLNFFSDRNIASLPSEKIKLIKEKKEKAINFLDLESIKRLLSSPDTSSRTGLRDKALLETLFSTGLRVSELVSLDRDQIKIKENTEDLEIVVVGKGDYPRTVYLSKRAVKALRDYLKTRKDDYKPLFIRYKGPKESSPRLSVRSVENIVKRYSKEAGLPPITSPHTLRHSYATDLLAQGVDLRVIQEFLGHKNIATTQIYTHITSKKLRDIHRKFHSGKRLEED